MKEVRMLVEFVVYLEEDDEESIDANGYITNDFDWSYYMNNYSEATLIEAEAY